jgi:hypothetical protein
MATNVGDAAKYAVLNGGVKLVFNKINLLNEAANAGATLGAISVGSTDWTLSGTTLSNTNALVFQCAASQKPYHVEVSIDGTSNSSIVFPLTDVPVGGYDFTTAGTFTIPIGDLTISVA